MYSVFVEIYLSVCSVSGNPYLMLQIFLAVDGNKTAVLIHFVQLSPDPKLVD